MAHYGLLRDFRFAESAEDIRGAKLYGLDDEKLGNIDDVIFDYSTGLIRYVVVDTGGWLSTKKFVVPADRLRASAEHEEDFVALFTKRQVEAFPPYQEADLESDQQWADYEGRYRSKWESSPVMHRVGTDRNITPTTQQMSGNSPSERAASSGGTSKSAPETATAPATAGSETADTAESGFAAGTGSVVISSNAAGIGGRWDTFQDRLRERRKEVIGGKSAA